MGPHDSSEVVRMRTVAAHSRPSPPAPCYSLLVASHLLPPQDCEDREVGRPVEFVILQQGVLGIFRGPPEEQTLITGQGYGCVHKQGLVTAWPLLSGRPNCLL